MFSKLTRKLKKYSGIVQPSVPNPRDSDIYLVSYPKSGNTWMRYLLAYAIWPDIDSPDLEDMAGLIPSFGLKKDIACMLDPSTPCNQLEHRIIKEHFSYGPVARKYVNNVIYICRDGRDAIVSYWHFWNQANGTSYTLDTFIRESAGHPYGSWHNHVRHWLDAPVNSLVIRYEDMLNDPAMCLEKALGFAGLPAGKPVINRAVSRSSFASMQALEKNSGFNLDLIENVDFVRQGQAGTWKEYFTDETLAVFREHHGPGITSLGYEW